MQAYPTIRRIRLIHEQSIRQYAVRSFQSIMAGATTRRQAAAAAAAAATLEHEAYQNGSSIATKREEDNDEIDTTEYDGPKENIFLFWPNIIGYSRIILAIVSLYYMNLHPRTCCLLYSISCLLDALDGYAARHFEQSTRFGAVLDMVTDRYLPMRAFSSMISLYANTWFRA